MDADGNVVYRGKHGGVSFGEKANDDDYAAQRDKKVIADFLLETDERRRSRKRKFDII